MSPSQFGRIDAATARKLGLPARPLKYHNRPVREADGTYHASRKEYRRFGQLRLLEQAGRIKGLRRQVRFPLKVRGILVAVYVADFVYKLVPGGELVVEDAKGVRTRDYRIKRQLMLALHKVTITES